MKLSSLKSALKSILFKICIKKKCLLTLWLNSKILACFIFTFMSPVYSGVFCLHEIT